MSTSVARNNAFAQQRVRRGGAARKKRHLYRVVLLHLFVAAPFFCGPKKGSLRALAVEKNGLSTKTATGIDRSLTASIGRRTHAGCRRRMPYSRHRRYAFCNAAARTRKHCFLFPEDNTCHL
jgi:hypothetical protein